MQLQVGVLPPREVVEAVTDAVRSSEQAGRPAEAPVRRGLFRRRPADADERRPPGPSAVAVLEADQACVPMARFGNLTVPESMRLAEEIGADAAGWPAPRLYAEGLGATVTEGSLAVGLHGDVDELTDIARGVTRSVERLGLFVDRRAFRAALVVATVRVGAGPGSSEDVDRVNGVLAAHRGAPWTVDHLSLLKLVHDEGMPRLREVAQLPLATP